MTTAGEFPGISVRNGRKEREAGLKVGLIARRDESDPVHILVGNTSVSLRGEAFVFIEIDRGYFIEFVLLVHPRT